MRAVAAIGSVLRLPLNSERLGKLTEDSLVDNSALRVALGWKSMPVRAEDGLKATLKEFACADK
jgi:nucleoside-diphosphate-sugar epimerase